MKIETEDGEFDHKELAANYYQGTLLSQREAELYVLTELAGLSVTDAAEEMGVARGTAAGKRGRIRAKIQKAEETARLEI